MIDRKVYKESQLIIRGASISLISSGGNGDLETFLKKVLKGYKWYLGNSDILYVEQKNSAEIIILLKEAGRFREN